MYYKVNSGIIVGMDAHLISVESDVSEGMPSMDLVGSLSGEVREAKERVRTAMKNSGIFLPPKRITINISPGNIRKTGTSFDLPIALSIMGCMEIIDQAALLDTMCLGELGLSGEVKKINGVLPMVLKAAECSMKRVIVPLDNVNEALSVSGIEVLGVENLDECKLYLQKKISLKSKVADKQIMLDEDSLDSLVDFSQIKGQASVKRALEIAAAGLHNTLIIGPPGAGKTLSAKALPTIMPKLTFEEALHISKIYSIAGLLEDCGIKTSRPFVNPHHTSTARAIVGGGAVPMPGAISLADKGVLFLDELPEFKKDVLDVLRQPLEERKIVLSKSNYSCVYPADFLLVAAANPCKCGYYPDRNRCSCTDVDVKKYLGRISGPLIDRIDICVNAKEIQYDELSASSAVEEKSEVVRERVNIARQIQENRFKTEKISVNSHMNSMHIEKYCPLGKNESNILREVFTKLKLSARSYHKIIKTARTIADLEQSEDIKEKHLLEAVGYRGMYEL